MSKATQQSTGAARAANPQPEVTAPPPPNFEQERVAFTYTPGKTLGRTGFTQDPEDRLAERVGQLDALLCLIADTGPGEEGGLPSMNEHIQYNVLRLASSLANEIHELHEETWTDRYRASREARGEA